MSDDSSAFLLSVVRDLAEDITAAVDDMGRLLKPAFTLMTDELEALKQREAQLVLHSRKIVSDSIRQHKDSMLLAVDSSILKLNVGGKDINVRRSSILPRTSPDSLFSILVSGRWDNHLTKDRNGRIFLDIDPEWIEVVINVLRDTGRIVRPCVALEKDNGFRAILACYNLGSLFSDFTIDLSEASDIGSMNDQYNREILHSFLRPELAEEKPRRFPLKLLYRYPRDGASPTDLHSRCQGNGNTLTVIEDTNGSVLGCYAEGKWNLSSPVVEGKKNFFFCLTTNPPEKLELPTLFLPDPNPVYTFLHFGHLMHMGTVNDACCNIGCFVGGDTSGTVKDLSPKAFKPKKLKCIKLKAWPLLEASTCQLLHQPPYLVIAVLLPIWLLKRMA